MGVPEAPKFKAYAEGEPIPPVDPEDIKRTWEYDRTHSKVGANGWEWLLNRQAVCSPGADVADVSSRCQVIETLNQLKLIAPWRHGDELDDAVFRIAAIFPLKCVKRWSYQLPGDQLYPFDPNAFLQQLIEETGVTHSWEPVRTVAPEGRRCFGLMNGTESQDPEILAKRQARELLWVIWERLDPLMACFPMDKAPEMIAARFADFVIDNLDLFREVEAGIKAGNGGGGLPVLMELERRAQRRA